MHRVRKTTAPLPRGCLPRIKFHKGFLLRETNLRLTWCGKRINLWKWLSNRAHSPGDADLPLYNISTPSGSHKSSLRIGGNSNNLGWKRRPVREIAGGRRRGWLADNLRDFPLPHPVCLLHLLTRRKSLPSAENASKDQHVCYNNPLSCESLLPFSEGWDWGGGGELGEERFPSARTY